MNNDHIQHGNSIALILISLFIIAIIGYIAAAVLSNRQYRRWPISRTILWCFGVVCAALAVTGPLAKQAYYDFTAHMMGHLLLGMLSPLLLVMAAPMTLFLRTLNVKSARQLSRILKSRPVRVLNDPAAASLLNIGGLWILYTTNVFEAMQEHLFLHIFIHVHVFLAGYIFTMSMIYIDPAPHRTSFYYRAIVLIIALAGHGILSKYIYNHPPGNVPLEQAQLGGMLMYYGGDVIDIILIYLFCMQWYRASKPPRRIQSANSKMVRDPSTS